MARLEWSGAHVITWNPKDIDEDSWAARQLKDLQVRDQGDGVTLEVTGATMYETTADGLRRATTQARLTEVFTKETTERE